MAWLVARLRQFLARRWRLAVVLVVFLAAAALGGPQLLAYYHWHAAQSDLEQFRAASAQTHLQTCLRVWPSSVSVHRLASRAARLRDDFTEAEQHLRTCQRLQPNNPEEVVFEWALLHASGGDLREVQQYLERQAQKKPADAPLVWEALAKGLARTYRILEGIACVDRWLKLQPDSVPALTLRGKIWHKGRSYRNALPDLQRAVQLDPAHDDAHWNLALVVLELGRFDEALPHLEILRAKRPDDVELLVLIARCHQATARLDKARLLLDTILAEHPDHGLALRTRGMLELTADNPAEAEKWLRKAVQALPHDYHSKWSLYQALQRLGKTSEADAALVEARRQEDLNLRLEEIIAVKMSERPNDPALHCELGSLFMQLNQEDLGVRWLQSALQLNPNYRPAHAALAEYYKKRGETEQAALHRQQAS
jgi:tetratricopeptide (TPR) repeat protein